MIKDKYKSSTNPKCRVQFLKFREFRLAYLGNERCGGLRDSPRVGHCPGSIPWILANFLSVAYSCIIYPFVPIIYFEVNRLKIKFRSFVITLFTSVPVCLPVLLILYKIILFIVHHHSKSAWRVYKSRE
jgi:hypothetical protein